jgi:hypothetical protein
MRSILALAAACLAATVAIANPPAAGCNSCQPGLAAHGATGQHVAGLFRIGGGCAMPNGCSSHSAERTFLFGSCKQFFNAGSDCGMKMKLNPLAGPIPNCAYSSYLNR